MAAAPAARVTGSLTLFPGSTVEYTPEATGFTLLFAPGWACLAAGLLVFVAVARPWRVLTGRSAAAAAHTSGR